MVNPSVLCRGESLSIFMKIRVRKIDGQTNQSHGHFSTILRMATSGYLLILLIIFLSCRTFKKFYQKSLEHVIVIHIHIESHSCQFRSCFIHHIIIFLKFPCLIKSTRCNGDF